MAILEAIPTEYKGVAYRSKSEAMFALWLDLSDPACNVTHEPNYLSTKDGWIPDFFVWHIEFCFGNKSVPGIVRRIFEYKPSKPTSTYLKTYLKRTREIDSSFKNCYGSPLFTHYLFFGSVYNDDRGIVTVDEGGLAVEECDWLSGCENVVRNYRFDLEANLG